jgi:murein DD-endopeptidase MepM/ murein hydrolase activator NlpD
MRHFWTTAAAIALCAISTPTWAASDTPASSATSTTHHHHKAHSSTGSSGQKSKKHAKKGGSSSSSHHRKGRHGKKTEPALEDSSSAPSASGKHHRRHGKHGSAGLRREQTTASDASRGHRRHHAASSAIHSEGGSVKVGRHQTLAQISEKTGVSEAELAKLNHLKKPYHVKAGQRLRLPGRRYYVVRSGDTLYSLSRRFGVEESELKSLNHITSRHAIKSGQKLYLPSGAEDQVAAEEARQRAESENIAPRRHNPLPPTYAAPETNPPPPGVVNPRPSAMPPPVGEQQNGFELSPSGQPAARPAPPPVSTGPLLPQSGPAPSSSDVVAAGKGKFLWPASGALISGFGPKAGGQRNDGVNISASLGEPVRAAADGEVVYAGDQVPSFGNLVLVKHAGGWVTAYAHMSRIDVKNRDHVAQGQEIGVVGQSGSVDRPQLHFEIRYAASPKDKATPVDPMLLLPAR